MDEMAGSSSSVSSVADFGLLWYLEELSDEELNKFKLLLKETTESGHCLMPWTAVQMADREQLTNLINKHYPGKQAWKMILRLFGKLSLKGLCESTKTETNWTAETLRAEVAEAGEALAQEALLGDRTEYKTRIKEKFHILDKNSLLREPSDFHHGVSQEHQKLLEHLFDVDVKTDEQRPTVVLRGAAGVGKTALMRKAMLDWAEGSLYQHKFTYVFYLGGREISSHTKEKSFAQLISKDWPSTEIPIERILSQPSSLLFIIDSFDELNFAFEEPEFALCGDWTQVHPVSFLVSSLLRRVMLPESSLLVTVRLTAFNRLKRLLKSHRYVDLRGLSKDATKEYIYQVFEDETWAMKAFDSIRNSERLFQMCRVPLVCRLVCACLKQQMEKNDDVTKTCQTATAVFTCCVSSLFSPEDEYFPNLPNEAQLRSLCCLAAKGVWTMTHVLYRKDLRKHGLTTCDTSVFLDMNILQKDTEYENCYVFTHPHIQEFFGALFYMLKSDWEDGERSSQSFEDLNLLLETTRDQDPHLTQLKYFLFGLLNEDLIKQLEETLKCKVSLKIKWEVLQWIKGLANSNTCPLELELLDLFHYLYETQDEAFVAQVMGNFSEVDINIYKEIHLLVSSFCLKHGRCLQTLRLAVTMLNSTPAAEMRQIDGDHMDGDQITHCWQNLFSVLNTNEHLTELDLSHSNLGELIMKIFYQELKHPNCKLQKLLLKSVAFPDCYQDIFSFLTQKQSLMHLDLKGSNIEGNGVRSLCEALKHPECKLQNLRLESCNLTAVCCLDISKVLIKSQSLVFLNLSTNNLRDDGVKLLCEALGHAECYLERLSLESCGLTEASCKDLSLALIGNKRLTHLCLANNAVGDRGVKHLSAALKHPACTLQSLVLRCCHFTPLSSEYLSTSLLHNKSLTHLDLGSNCLQDDGASLLCNVLQQPSCNLQDLELMSCVLTTACCPDLASTILNSPNLLSLDLGYNDLQDEGVKILCEALRNPNCNIQTLGLEYCGLTFLCCQDLSSALLSNQRLIKMNLTQNILGREGIRTLCEVLRCPECKLQVLGLHENAFDKEARRLLEAVRVSNPNLAIKASYDNHNEKYRSWWGCF